MKEFLLKNIAYEHWANVQLLRAIEQSGTTDERTLQLMAHLLASPALWLHRVRKETPPFGLWPTLSLDECRALNEQNAQQWTEWLTQSSAEELQSYVVVKVPATGQEKKLMIQDAVQHSSNHGSYHRGQIILRLKGLIDPLPLTTYIAFALEDLA
ncbi:MAG: DinB family protein [Spirosomataceae bacterium]